MPYTLFVETLRRGTFEERLAAWRAIRADPRTFGGRRLQEQLHAMLVGPLGLPHDATAEEVDVVVAERVGVVLRD
jgi:hypothetical protein